MRSKLIEGLRSIVLTGNAERVTSLVALSLALGCGALAHAGGRLTMVCELRGGQENPAVATAARGCGRFEIDTNANTLSFYIAFGGLSTPETMAHIHGPADPGANASVLFTLPAGNPKVGVWNYPEKHEAAILAGRMYANIHTVTNPGGEIRGQINSFSASLDAFQENPPTGVASSGWATFNIDLCNNLLSYYIVVESLSAAETAAHIHGIALPGTNVGILHTLPAGPIKVGTWNYNESQEPAILSGLTYVNVHTTANLGGEIRGQIVNTIAPMDGSQEVPLTVTPLAFGCGVYSFDSAADTLGYYITYAGLTTPESAAHIHGYAPAGMNAGVVHPLPASNPKKGVWMYGAANEANVFGGLTYANIHTALNSGGEIRGQIIPAIAKCAGDTNCDGSVNVTDLLDVIGGWGACPANPAPCPADTDYSGAVNVTDLLSVIAAWGTCP